MASRSRSTRACSIPRPDTETLVDLALDTIRARLAAAPRPPGTPPLRLWDVATGSGAIPIAIAVELRRLRASEHLALIVSDVSPDALAVTLENAVAHGVADRLEAAVGDLFHVEPPPTLPVDLVTANLPYVPSAVVPTLAVAASFEPVLALDGGPDGLDLVRRLLDGLPAVLAPGGTALLEIGSDQGASAPEEAQRPPARLVDRGPPRPRWTAARARGRCPWRPHRLGLSRAPSLLPVHSGRRRGSVGVPHDRDRRARPWLGEAR